MIRLSAVIFDMDGTLVDSLEGVPAAYIATVELLTGRIFTVDEVVANYSVGPGKAMLSVLLGRPCQENDLTLYHDHLRQGLSLVRTYPSIEASLSKLSETMKLGVFTGAGRGPHRFSSLTLVFKKRTLKSWLPETTCCGLSQRQTEFSQRVRFSALHPNKPRMWGMPRTTCKQQPPPRSSRSLQDGATNTNRPRRQISWSSIQPTSSICSRRATPRLA